MQLNFRNNQPRTILLDEKFNTTDTPRLLLSDLIDTTGKRILQKYLKKLEGGHVEVAYTNDDLGRLEAKMTNLKKNEFCSTQMNLYNVMKAVGCKGIYTDVDIKNCHPTLLEQLFQHEKCATTYLSMYIKDREKLISQMGVTKKAIKNLMFGLIYNSGHFNEKKWMKEHSVKVVPKLFYAMQTEVQANTAKVLEKYNEFRMLAKKRKQPGYWNLDGSALSYLAQQMEKTCLLAMYDYMEEAGWTVGALIHDGMHVEGNLSPDVLASCCAYVQDKTGFAIQLEVKPFEDYEDRLSTFVIVEDDVEARDIVLKALETSEYDLVSCNGRMYFREDDLYTADATKDHDTIQSPLMNFINQLTLFKATATGAVSVSSNLPAANNIMKFVFNKARKDKHFVENMTQWCRGKLCYANGYYDFKSKTLAPYDDDSCTKIRIERDLDLDVTDAEVKELYDRVLNPIFTENAKLRDFWLKTMARIMAGHVEDKQWLVMMGERNSGKGVLVMLFLSAFGDYVTTTSANNFLSKSGSGDSALDMKWAVDLDMVRLVFTNEIKMADDRDTMIDGNLMKQIIASGGDLISCRRLYENIVKFSLESTFCLMLNDMPACDPADAMANCVEFHMNSEFVKHDPRPDGIVKQYKADGNIKTDYIKTDRCIRAFTKVLFSHYHTEIPEVPKEIIETAQENEAESDLAHFERIFEFSNNKNDFVTCKQFESMVSSKLSVSKKKAIGWLKKKGIKMGDTKRITSGDSASSNTKNTRVYKGIRVNQKEMQSGDNDCSEDSNDITDDLDA